MTVLRLTPAASWSGQVRERGWWAVRWIAFWTLMAGLALMTAVMASAGATKVLLGPAALVAGGALARIVPVPMLLALLFLSGAGGSLFAFTGAPIDTAQSGLIAALIAAAVAGAFFPLPGTRARMPLGAALLLVLVLSSVSWVLLAERPTVAFEVWRAEWLFVAMALAVAYVPIRSKDLERKLVVGFLLVGAALAGYAIVRWVIGAAPQERELFETAAGRYAVLDGSTERVIGAIGDAHALSSWMAAFVPLSLAVALNRKGMLRVVALVALGACFAVIIGSEVRSALAATAVGVVLVLGVTLTGRSLGARRLLAVGFAALIAAMAVAGVTLVSSEDSRLLQRFSAIADPTHDPAFQERRFKWDVALRSIDDAPAGRGLGLGGTHAYSLSRFPSAGTTGTDSSYLKMAFEQGIYFTALFVLALLGMLAALIRHVMTTTDRWSATIAAGAAGTLLTFGLHLNFEMLYIEVPGSLASWMVIGLGLRQLARA